MTPEAFQAAYAGLPCPDGVPPEPYRIMRITYEAYRAGEVNVGTGKVIRDFVSRWDTLTDSEKNSLRTFAEAVASQQPPL